MLTDGRTEGRTTDAGVTGILIAHLGAFGSGELINYLHSSKNTLFRKVDLILIVKPDIIIIVMNTDKKISLFKIYKTSTHFRPTLWAETY